MILGAVLIFTAPLSHMIFSKTNPKVDSYKKELALTVLDVENKITDNRCDLENNIIKKDRYLYNLDSLNTQKKNIIEQNEVALNLFIDKNRVFGWRTTRDFILGLGVRLPYLLLSFIVSFLIFKINTKEKSLKRYFFWLQISCYSISFYFMFWVFWTSQDFPLKTYRWIFVLFSIISSIATVYFISYKKAFQLKSSLIIEKLIVLVLTNDKYIERKKNKKRHLEETIESVDQIIS